MARTEPPAPTPPHAEPAGDDRDDEPARCSVGTVRRLRMRAEDAEAALAERNAEVARLRAEREVERTRAAVAERNLFDLRTRLADAIAARDSYRNTGSELAERCARAEAERDAAPRRATDNLKWAAEQSSTPWPGPITIEAEDGTHLLVDVHGAIVAQTKSRVIADAIVARLNATSPAPDCERCDGKGWVYGYNEGVPCSQDPCPLCDATPPGVSQPSAALCVDSPDRTSCDFSPSRFREPTAPARAGGK